jgi:hypothetical protein
MAESCCVNLISHLLYILPFATSSLNFTLSLMNFEKRFTFYLSMYVRCLVQPTLLDMMLTVLSKQRKLWNARWKLARVFYFLVSSIIPFFRSSFFAWTLNRFSYLYVGCQVLYSYNIFIHLIKYRYINPVTFISNCHCEQSVSWLSLN